MKKGTYHCAEINTNKNKNMNTFNFEPQYDSRKSFYGKAKVIKDGETVKLQSYDTIVAEYNPMTRKLKINGYYSPTTARHINEFICQYAVGYSAMSKKTD